MPWRASLRDLRVQVIQESRRFTLRSGNVLSSQWNKVRRFVRSKSSSTQTTSNSHQQGIISGDQSKGYDYNHDYSRSGQFPRDSVIAPTAKNDKNAPLLL